MHVQSTCAQQLIKYSDALEATFNGSVLSSDMCAMTRSRLRQLKKREAEPTHVIHTIKKAIDRVLSADAESKISIDQWEQLKTRLDRFCQKSNPQISVNGPKTTIESILLKQRAKTGLFAHIQYLIQQKSVHIDEHAILFTAATLISAERLLYRNAILLTVASKLLTQLQKQFFELGGALQPYGGGFIIDWKKIQNMTPTEFAFSMHLHHAFRKNHLSKSLSKLIHDQKHTQPELQRIIELWILYDLIADISQKAQFIYDECITHKDSILNFRISETEYQVLAPSISNIQKFLGTYSSDDTLEYEGSFRNQLIDCFFNEIQQTVDFTEIYEKIYNCLTQHNSQNPYLFCIHSVRLPRHFRLPTPTEFRNQSFPQTPLKDIEEKISEYISRIEITDLHKKHELDHALLSLSAPILQTEWPQSAQHPLLFEDLPFTSQPLSEAKRLLVTHPQKEKSSHEKELRKKMGNLHIAPKKKKKSKPKKEGAHAIQSHETVPVEKLPYVQQPQKRAPFVEEKENVFSSNVQAIDDNPTPWIEVSKKTTKPAKSFQKFLTKIRLHPRIHRQFELMGIVDDPRFQGYSPAEIERMELFKRYPVVVTYFSTCHGLEDSWWSDLKQQSNPHFVMFGEIQSYASGKEKTYQGFFTDCFEETKESKMLYHHTFTERSYNELMNEYAQHGRIQLEKSEETEDKLETIIPSFHYDEKRFQISENPYLIEIDDTAAKVKYRLIRFTDE